MQITVRGGRNRKRILFCLLVSCFWLVTAWTPVSEQRIAEKSAMLAPPDLQLLLTKYAAEYKRGVTAAAGDEATEAHRFIVARRSGKLRSQIELETATVIRM